MASVRATTDTKLLTIPKQQMDDLLRSSPTAARSLFGVLLSRWRETEASLRQSVRMAQIGTLTAGLAHEMNNPAAAVSRGAGQLGAAVDRLTEAMGEIRARGLHPASDKSLAGLLDSARERPVPLGALERADREAEIEAAITELGEADAWRLAPPLAAAGVKPTDLRSALGGLSSDDATLVVRTLGAAAETASLVREVEEGAERLSAIVGALKSYSYLDRAAVQEVDVRRGIDDTLLILNQKLEGVDVRREYPDYPLLIRAYAGELNQVWTNLIDNAADAVAGHEVSEPTIEVRARASDGGVIVEIEDNGPGIPDDLVGRIFDAFFTTKPPGSGTGLGLDISYRIVAHRHRGDMTVESAPGRTVFRVTLPQDPG
jgi:C4-dicarboxylate-specific signal transduction histidine kinase